MVDRRCLEGAKLWQGMKLTMHQKNPLLKLLQSRKRAEVDWDGDGGVEASLTVWIGMD